MANNSTNFRNRKDQMRMCRACMAKDQYFHHITEFYAEHPLRICEMLAAATPQLQLQYDDGLSDVICVVCLNKLNITYHFQQLCLSTERRMQAMRDKRKRSFQATIDKSNSKNGAKEEVENASEFLQLRKSIKVELSEYANELNEPTSEQLSRDVVQTIDVIKVQEEEQNKSNEFRSISKSERLVISPVNLECSASRENAKFDAKKESFSNSTPKKMEGRDTGRSIHNDTCVDDIEKPNERNRRKSQHPCPDCGKHFDRLYRLRRHAVLHSSTRRFVCDICAYRFGSKNHLAIHRTRYCAADHSEQLSSPPIEGHKCPDCPRRFEKRESLSAHMQVHRKQTAQLFCCEHCCVTFTKLSLLTKHARIHSETDKKYQSAQQNSTGKEQQHLRLHSGEKSFLCPQCGKAFQNSSNMRQHMLRHSGERRYQCPECPSRFACQSDRSKHMSTHRTTKPHICDICGSSFTRSYSLAKHKHIHSGERPYKCEDCNMSFVFLEHVRRHMRTHTGEKPYKCRFCSRAYAESGDLTKHLRVHIGENTYKCEQCSATFKYQTELRDHQIKHYKEQRAMTAITDELVMTESASKIS